MWFRRGHLATLVLAAAAIGHAAQIEGEVVIRRKLTHRTVTASASAYQRGPSVPLAPPSEEDPLAFERRHVVVYLEGKLPSEPVAATLEQKNRRFTPDLLVVPAGSTVSFPNRDIIFHNVFSLAKAKSFDLGNYPKDETRSVTLPKPGIVYVNCHLHPNMTASIVVTPNGWHTVPDRSGKFLLSDVPPGRHTIVAWHKTAGFFRQAVDMRADGTTSVTFLIPLDEDGRTLTSSAR